MMICGAVFSPCRTWRYTLTRIWHPGRPVMNVIGLNPSTADETRDDPTIRRCTHFAMRDGYGGLVMTNIFAFRATDPSDMKVATDPVGPDNDRHLREQAARAGRVIAAWGAHGRHLGRGDAVAELLAGFDLHCWRLTKEGHPAHPLYLPARLTSVRFGQAVLA